MSHDLIGVDPQPVEQPLHVVAKARAERREPVTDPGRCRRAKSALNTFTRHIAAEAAPHGITVNAIAPGAVRAPASAAQLTPDREALLRTTSLLGRMLEPPDIAAVVGLLTEDATRAVTGAVIRVDAGYSVLAGGPSSLA
jgi:3-oxoacyl-[acyl-carrier protein] reductase